MDLDEKTQEKIKELQAFEQNLQNLLMQKQAFQMELSETENALSEITKTKDDVYKMIGQVMIKTDKKKTTDELKKKQELISLRLKSIETQEEELGKQAEELREEVMKKIK
jgi:prefoldin beta subunit